MSPELANVDTVELHRRTSDGPTQRVTDGAIFGHGFVDWQANAGEYELRSNDR